MSVATHTLPTPNPGTIFQSAKTVSYQKTKSILSPTTQITLQVAGTVIFGG
jgi:hypothetical protein